MTRFQVGRPGTNVASHPKLIRGPRHNQAVGEGTNLGTRVVPGGAEATNPCVLVELPQMNSSFMIINMQE